MQEVLDAATPTDWREPDPELTVYLQLANGGRAVIELAPQFAPKHVANIQQLLREGYFDGLAIVRSQDNFVVQWGDPDADDASKARKFKQAAETLPAEFTAPAAGLRFTRMKDVDGWAPEVGFVDGFPAARNPKEGVAWLAHCYGNVGAGRGGAPDSSNGSSLYVVTGQSPRQLDRNITSVGRVIAGMEWLSVLPRGGGPLGFYEKPEQRTGIVGMRLASDLPADQCLPLQVLRTDTATWDKLVEARRNRRDDWYVHPAGHIDLCNVPEPVRMKP
ncbi:MAG TPA: peptidylprolyl isomerase [Arenimonas sp.]|nr:peptidylprolyl isomerase [Arenimonas sp.]